ncbi:MAG: protein-disulfide reductase DsbD domain-containing protein [Pseudomonadota bacterium]
MFKLSHSRSKLAALLFLAAAPASLHAQDAWAAEGAWFETDGVKIRLVTAVSASGQTVDAGLQIILEEGWKTYWRSPGSSGIPPQLNFLGSQNVASATLRFPTPSVLNDVDGISAGYKNEVVFPIDVKLNDPAGQVNLKANGFIGVCKEICIPVQFTVEVKEPRTAGSSFQALTALAKGRGALSKAATDNQRIHNLNFVNENGPVLTATAKVPDGASSAELFVEGPYNWYLSPTKAKSIEDGVATFEIPLRSLPKTAKPVGTKVQALLVADGKSTEQSLTIAKAGK